MDESEHQNLWATEQRRRSILALLEVQPLAARFNPPGAREARPLNPPPESKVSSQAGRVNGALMRSEIQSNEPAAARGPGQAKPPRELTSELVPEGTLGNDGSLARGKPVAFQLLIVEAGAWLWLEQLDDNLIRREQLQLVEGMARAITNSALNLRHHQFDWPLANHAHLPKDAESAKQSVAGQLRRLARERQALGMVLMGPSCKDWVDVPPALTQLNIPSTLSMLENPALKRAAWQVLKPHTPKS